MQDLKKLVSRLLREYADKIDAGTCELSMTEAMDIMRILGHEVMSKAQAYRYLNMSRSRFDALVGEGKLPKGKSRVGFKELVWYRDELDIAIKKYKGNKFSS